MDDSELEYVGFWPRVGAALIDSILICFVTVPLLTALYGWDYWREVNAAGGFLGVLINYVLPAIAVICFWIAKQSTPGKMIISARIVDAETGNAPTVGQAIGRYLGYFVSMIPLFLGIIWVGLDTRKQGWHDKLAGTVVVRPKNRGGTPVTFKKSVIPNSQQAPH